MTSDAHKQATMYIPLAPSSSRAFTFLILLDPNNISVSPLVLQMRSLKLGKMKGFTQGLSWFTSAGAGIGTSDSSFLLDTLSCEGHILIQEPISHTEKSEEK